MMEAYVSPSTAALYIEINGQRMLGFLNDRETLHPADDPGLRRLLRSEAAFQKIEVDKLDDAWSALDQQVAVNEALTLLDLLADTRLSGELRTEIAVECEDLLKDDATLAAVKAVVLSMEKDGLEAILSFLADKSGLATVIGLVETTSERQPTINEVSRRLDDALRRHAVSDASARTFRCTVIDRGLFAGLVESWGDRGALTSVALNAYQAAAHLPDSRSIIGDWTKGQTEKPSKRSLRALARDAEHYERSELRYSASSPDQGAYRFEAARKQVEHIKGKLRAGDTNTASRFADQLLQFQVQLGDNEFAAKSLCSLAVFARRMGYRSLECEWAQKAVKAAPHDGFAHGVLADAHMNQFQFPEAIKEFEAAAAYGEVEFGLMGKARVLRETRRYEDALQIFGEGLNRYASDHTQALHAWIGYCSTLRDLWRLSEAEEAYRKALVDHAKDPVLLTGFASLLRLMGKLPEALVVAERAVSFSDSDAAALCTRARILGSMGRLPDALATYEEAIRLYPEEALAYAGFATALRLSAKPNEALQLLEGARNKLEWSMVFHLSLAEAQRASGDRPGALATYQDVLSRFDNEPRAAIGRATLFVEQGQFAQAIGEYDRTLQQFPYFLPAWSGRADLLKRSGRYTEALEAYSSILKEEPSHPRAKVALAALYVATSRYDEADKLLSHDRPQTLHDWTGMHVLGMSALRQGRLEEARCFFQQGLNEVPFHWIKEWFRNGLALLHVREGRYQETIDLIRAPETASSHIVLSFGYLQLGRFDEAVGQLKAINDNEPEPVIRLRDRVAVHAAEHNRTPLDRDWFAEHQSEVILQAA